MFIGGLEAEIQDIVWRSWKNELVQSCVFYPIVHSLRQLSSVHTNGENWTKRLFDDFRKRDLYLYFKTTYEHQIKFI